MLFNILNKKRLFKLFLGIILILPILAFIVLPVIMGIAVALPQHSIVGQLNVETKEVTLTTDDGVNLKAWYEEPKNGSVIILFHGASNSRENMKPYIEILLANDYGVLAVDQRGHGESGGNANRLGWAGTKDVGAAVKFLKNRPGVERIGALGNSMGGEVMLGAASTYPEIEAIVSEGATYRSYDEFYATQKYSSTAKKLSSSRITYLTTRLVTATNPPKPTILDSIKQSNAKFLFIAAGTKENEKDYNNIYSSAVGDRSELWVVDGAKHTGALSKDPKAYTEKVINFFNINLK